MLPDDTGLVRDGGGHVRLGRVALGTRLRSRRRRR